MAAMVIGPYGLRATRLKRLSTGDSCDYLVTIVSLAGIYKNSVTDLRDNSLYSRDFEENEIGREESSSTLVERQNQTFGGKARPLSLD